MSSSGDLNEDGRTGGPEEEINAGSLFNRIPSSSKGPVKVSGKENIKLVHNSSATSVDHINNKLIFKTPGGDQAEKK